MLKHILLALLFLIIAHILTFFQMQGQFLWDWAKKHTFLLSLFGIPLAYLFIMFTKYCVLYFEGQIWPARLIGFAVGAIIFAILSYIFFNESITLKTGICLSLAVIILLIQIFWK